MYYSIPEHGRGATGRSHWSGVRVPRWLTLLMCLIGSGRIRHQIKTCRDFDWLNLINVSVPLSVVL